MKKHTNSVQLGMKTRKCHVIIENGPASFTSLLMNSDQWWVHHFKKNDDKQKELLDGEGSRKHF